MLVVTYGVESREIVYNPRVVNY